MYVFNLGKIAQRRYLKVIQKAQPEKLIIECFSSQCPQLRSF